MSQKCCAPSTICSKRDTLLECNHPMWRAADACPLRCPVEPDLPKIPVNKGCVRLLDRCTDRNGKQCNHPGWVARGGCPSVRAIGSKPTDPHPGRPSRYMNQLGGDWIDECALSLTHEQFTGAMIFTMGKYLRRMGKKDDKLKEIKKLADYAQRWAAYQEKHDE